MRDSARYSRGTIVLDKRQRGPDVWLFRYRDEIGKYVGIPFSDVQQCRTRSQARLEADRQRLPEKYIVPAKAAKEGRKTFGQIINRYKKEEMPARFSTNHSYSAWIENHIAPQWEKTFIQDVEPGLVETWLTGLQLSGKSKAHIKTVMTALFNCAIRWKWFELGLNPMQYVRIKGGVRRKSKPHILTPEQFAEFLGHVKDEHVRVIVFTLMAVGVRLSEVLGLKWGDVKWDKLEVQVSRGVVLGRVGDVKTEYSEAPVPLAPELAEELLAWQRTSEFAKDENYIFASPWKAGEKPYFSTAIQRKIHAAAKAAGLGHLFRGEPTKIMRHSYRSWLDSVDAPIGVIKDLMRHSDIRTAMNVYGKGMPEPMIEANRKVVQMIRKKTG